MQERVKPISKWNRKHRSVASIFHNHNMAAIPIVASALQLSHDPFCHCQGCLIVLERRACFIVVAPTRALNDEEIETRWHGRRTPSCAPYLSLLSHPYCPVRGTLVSSLAAGLSISYGLSASRRAPGSRNSRLYTPLGGCKPLISLTCYLFGGGCRFGGSDADPAG
jgi:hypothetical protein